MDRRLTHQLTAFISSVALGTILPVGIHQGRAQTVSWEHVPDGEVIRPEQVAQESAARTANAAGPADQATAEEIIRNLPPVAEDYQPVTTLGAKFPTAFVIPDGEVIFSASQLSPVAGGGDAGGSGNQNFVAQVDLGLANALQLSVIYTDSDDPLFSQPIGFSPNPANKWESYAFAAQFQLIRQSDLGFSINGSLESFLVESGGCRSVGSDGCSANIFNGQRELVSTNNLVGSISAPFTWKASPSLELTLAPGVSFLPSSQGPAGADGEFFGTNVTFSASALWKVSPELRLYGSALLPLGPGTNTFNDQLEFSRVPIFSGGVQYALNPRIAFDLALTNSFGATPATAILTLPSSNQLLWMAKWSYVPGAKDSAPIQWKGRSRTLSLGGLTVGTAIIPPSGEANVSLSADDEGSFVGVIGYSLSNDFQIYVQANRYQNVNTDNSFGQEFLGGDGDLGNQAGGKAVFFHQLRGAPFSLAGGASFGQDAISNYLFGELIGTWEANDWLAFNINPKFARSGRGTPVSIGLGANFQIAKSFQLIPEINVAANDTAGTNATVALRWLPTSQSAIDLFISNAAGLISAGQLLETIDQTRIGARLTLQF